MSGDTMECVYDGGVDVDGDGVFYVPARNIGIVAAGAFEGDTFIAEVTWSAPDSSTVGHFARSLCNNELWRWSG